jgi:hypothetical protein
MAGRLVNNELKKIWKKVVMGGKEEQVASMFEARRASADVA